MKKIYLLMCVLALASCGEEVQKPTSAMSLEEVSFNDLKNFNNDNVDELKTGFMEICERIMMMRTPYISLNSEIKISTADYQAICKKNPNKDFKQFIKDNFNPYIIKDDDFTFGQFTSYFEPTINISKTKTDVYKYPIYGYPNDMVEFNLKDFAPELTEDKKIVARVEGKSLTPYYNREYIENNSINAPVLFWTDNLVDLHIMHIQGPAVGILPDGSKQRIAYAGNNGKEFKGIGSILIEKGLIKNGSMDAVKEWLEQNPEQARKLMQENNRFIFHRLVEARGPIGAMGLPLTAGRSLAVDERYIPLGSLMWLETVAPNKQKIEKLVIAQDVGSAIKGIIRGDYFWGTGHGILEHAGRMNASGKYYILLPKEIK
ncbi:MAG: MltA domain-containing protein [Alphaproteobacteria bacterium]